MASEVAGGMITHLFPSLGPALMISMGYIDLGKWVAAVEGGARFGYDLVFLVLLFNCTAIVEEYCRVACILLGVQAELSMIISDVTMILGIGHSVSLLFGMDLFAGIFCATVGVILLPSFLNLLDNCKAESLCIGAAGFALLFYVLGVLISQPEVPLVMNGIFPKLSGESAYSLMALLRANIMAHNFYVHSSIVKIGVIKAVKNSVAGRGEIAALRVTHRLEELKYADGAICMEDGWIVMQGDVLSVSAFVKEKQAQYSKYLNL